MYSQGKLLCTCVKYLCLLSCGWFKGQKDGERKGDWKSQPSSCAVILTFLFLVFYSSGGCLASHPVLVGLNLLSALRALNSDSAEHV